jgi:hypothetical protein
MILAGTPFPDLSNRERIGKLFGQEARHAGFDEWEAGSLFTVIRPFARAHSIIGG